MNTNSINIRNLLLAGAFIIASSFGSMQAQTQPATPPAPTSNTTQPAQILNPITELNLTPDQIRQWRALNQEFRPQEVAGTLRVREAKRALTEAMEAQTPNEDLIKQRAKELADAQSVMTQLQALRQARTLQILTPEQRIKLREIQKHNQEVRNQTLRGQQSAPNPLGQRQQLKRPNASLLTPAQRKALKQQQQTKPKS